MTRSAKRLATSWEVARAEGLAAVASRALDHLAEARRRRTFALAAPGSRPGVAVPVLNLSATPPAPWLGGVPTQLRERLASEARDRPVALLFPEGGGWRLELRVGVEQRAWRLAGGRPSPVTVRDAGFETMLELALETVGAHALHVEGLAGLPLESLLQVPRRGTRLLVSLHDFAGFCPRPHLLEQPAELFCEYCRDPDRCWRCLRQDWEVVEDFQDRRRETAAALLGLAEAVIHPSEFLRRTYMGLYPLLSPETQRVVVPGASGEVGPAPGERPGPVRHVAFVGSVKPHKGAGVFEDLVRSWGERRAGPRLRWSAYGGGDSDLLRRLRRLPETRVRGYYRAGALPRLLRRDRVDLALLLSITPESHSLVLSECRAAGVPCIAFDLGAVAERISREGGGVLVPLTLGAGGIAGALEDLFEGRSRVPPLRPPWPPPPASRAMLDLYRELGLASGPDRARTSKRG